MINSLNTPLVSSFTVDSQNMATLFSSTRVNGLAVILVLSGSGEININYRNYRLEKDSLLLLSSSHLFGFNSHSDDLLCKCMFVGNDFMEEMDSKSMIYKRIKYGVKLFDSPLIKLSESASEIVLGRLDSVTKAVGEKDHFYYKEVILNRIVAFYLDLSNILEKHYGIQVERVLTRYEQIIANFIEMLVNNYRTEHNVEFYASSLHISSHYLTRILKSITGRTPSDFIYDMLYSDSRSLLINSRLSVQEIASQLHFSDQSAFGKFFKRRRGISPNEFRKSLV